MPDDNMDFVFQIGDPHSDTSSVVFDLMYFGRGWNDRDPRLAALLMDMGDRLHELEFGYEHEKLSVTIHARARLASEVHFADALAPPKNFRLFADVRGTDADVTFYGGISGDELISGRGKDTLLGRGGNDELRGNRGRDNIDGGNGHDRIFGGADSDKIDGGDGRDVIDGGGDADVLDGNGGEDIFVYHERSDSIGDETDTIQNFESKDRIDLSDMVEGRQPRFIDGDGFSGRGPEIQIGQPGGHQIVQFDKDGDGRLDLRIVVEGHHQLTFDNFIV
jgi:hypothetical protein